MNEVWKLTLESPFLPLGMRLETEVEGEFVVSAMQQGKARVEEFNAVDVSIQGRIERAIDQGAVG